jgi:glycosyltransferase involved in cell wall biosynthesis
MKVAIVCDWLVGIGGAERVVLELHNLYPDAPIYTSQYDPSKIDWFNDADVRTTWLQRLPTSLKKFLPIFRAWTFSRLDLSEYDLVISSTGAEAKAVKTGPKTVHICYMHAPTQYYWARYDEYMENPGFPKGMNFIAKIGLKLLVGPLRQWDKRASKRPDYIVTNSSYSQSAIKKYYKRDSVVVYPPVETDRFKITGKPELRHGFVAAGRQTPYKRIDLAVEACNEAKVPLVVIGDGPDHKRLEKLGGRSTTFLTNVNDNDIVSHFQTAIGFIMPNADDFGIVAVEAMAAGTPVIAFGKGGALDYVVQNKTGLLFEKQTVKSLSAALEIAMAKNFNSEVIAEHARLFSVDEFKKKMRDYINKCLMEKKES